MPTELKMADQAHPDESPTTTPAEPIVSPELARPVHRGERLDANLIDADVIVDRPYHRAERLNLFDNVHGRWVHDPYRWLEDGTTPQTEAWSAAQDRLFNAHRETWRTRTAFRRHL